jgi:hypothetical protein
MDDYNAVEMINKQVLLSDYIYPDLSTWRKVKKEILDDHFFNLWFHIDRILGYIIQM